MFSIFEKFRQYQDSAKIAMHSELNQSCNSSTSATAFNKLMNPFNRGGGAPLNHEKLSPLFSFSYPPGVFKGAKLCS